MNTRILRKTFALIGILSIVMSMAIVAPMANAYSGADAPYGKEQVDQLIELGAIDATLDPGFGKCTTRAAGAVMLTKLFAEDVDAADLDDPEFADFDGAAWWGEAVKKAAFLGMFAGSVGVDGKKYFKPGDSMTREQFATVLWAAAGKPESDFEITLPDVSKISSWATTSAAWAAENGLMGKGAKFGPQDCLNKLDFVVVSGNTQTAVEEGNIELTFSAAEEEEEVAEEEEEEEEEEVPVEPVVVPTTATLAVASDTPPAVVLASGTAYNPVLKFSVAAGAEADLQVTSITVTRGGLSANANVAGIGVFDAEGKRHGNIGTSWNDSNAMEVSFAAEPIVVAKGTSSFIMLKANLATGAMTGTLILSVAKAEDFVSNATLTATFPLSSNAMTLADGSTSVATVTVDAVQVHANGTADTTAVNINLGTTKQQLATFRLSNGAVEAVTIKSIKLYNNGSAADGDVTNLALVGPDGVDIKVVEKTTNKYVAFDGLSVPLAKSASNKDYKLYGDVMNGSTRTFRPLLQNDYDLVVVGDTSKADILPTLVGGGTPTGNDRAFPVGDLCGGATTTYCNMITIAAGSLSFSKATTSPTGNIAAGGTSLTLGRFELKATGEDMEIRQFSYVAVRSAATDLSGTLYFKIREKDSTSYTTLYSIAGASADYTNNTSTYTTTFVKLTAGKTYYLEAFGDVVSTATAGLTYTIGPVDITQVKRVSTNDIVDPSVSTATANTLTVQTGTLSVTANSSAAAPNLVRGQAAGSVLATWDFTAGAGEGINITNVQVGTSTGGGVGNMGSNYSDLELWFDGVKKSQDTSSTISPSSTADTVTFNISPAFTVTAAQTSLVELKGKVKSTATAGTMNFTVAASGITGTGGTSQSALSSIPSAAVAAQTVTISTAGTLTVSRDTVTNVKASEIVAGTTNVVLGAYKLQTGNIEDVRIKKITIRNIGSNIDGIANIGIYDGATLLNDDSATTANEGIIKASLGASATTLGNDTKSVTFDYTVNPFVVPKNSYKVLTIKANTVYNATNGQTVQFVLDSLDLEGAGSSAKIYPTITSETASTTATNSYALGEVVFFSDGTAAHGSSSPVTTAVAAGATLDGVGVLVPVVDLVGGGTSTVYRVTKMNPVYFGSSIVSEAHSTSATYSYAQGDVVVVSDNSDATNNGFHVVTTTVPVGGTLSVALAGNYTMAVNDRITRVAAGAYETTLASAATTYNLGDILAVTDADLATNDGLYVVTNTIAASGDMTAGGTVASQAVQLQSGAALVTGDSVAKMPTLSTELASSSAVYAYSIGDVVVVDDDSTPANNGAYVVECAVAVGGNLLDDSLCTGITLAAADRISKLYVKPQEDNLKRLYPTKLNFTWTTPTSTTLLTGSQVEVGRFTLGADTANTNNPGASISVTALNLTELSTATLTNFLLNDVTQNANVASNANSSSFSSTAAGGTLTTLTFQQGESRTFKILADVATNAGSQIAQFRFNAGTQFSAGTATWSVTNNSVSSSSTWTVLASDAADVTSTSLQAASTGTDTTAPTISTIQVINGTAANTVDVADTIRITFSEKIDPATINTGLTYNVGTSTSGITAAAATTGNVTSTLTGSTTAFTVTNITTFTVLWTASTTVPPAVTVSAPTLGLNTAGTILDIGLATLTGGGASVATTAQTVTHGASVAGTVKDAAGNAMTSTGSSTASGSF